MLQWRLKSFLRASRATGAREVQANNLSAVAERLETRLAGCSAAPQTLFAGVCHLKDGSEPTFRGSCGIKMRKQRQS